ncbi:competence protein ComK [Oceanobacillus alkalisoli]|uniref:competence protein ComK n=1 Tax=Oceanobacillus alkalisoli TaxID=2925113 RepID=UPI001EF02181|nr:competence protein ComK [Oceanobacillus alkalisoli]MCF3942047.1 competence protein ComK [Oceanobacillus alkalisoli]MCG5102000.1 competence protein ComK [Oceanobacillus alkalisoli]
MEQKIFTSAHEISPVTMAIIASRDKDGRLISYILDETAEYVSHLSPSKLIDNACMFFGSSLKGRQEGSRVISGLTHKVPISIDPASGMYFLPTYSPTSPKCSWLSHSHIGDVIQLDEGNAEVLFINGKTITLDVSYGSLTNQVRRTAQFRYKLNNRLHHIGKGMIAENPNPFDVINTFKNERD